MVLAWPAPPAAADVLLFMNEADAHRRWRRRRGNSRALEQRLARATAQIERSEQHQASLRQVLKLAGDFQRTLSEPQRTRWLAFEEALLAHAERSQRAYFRAGVEVGKRGAAQRGTGSHRRDVRVEALSLLARLMVQLARL
jgi:hypothetical protein